MNKNVHKCDEENYKGWTSLGDWTAKTIPITITMRVTDSVDQMETA